MGRTLNQGSNLHEFLTSNFFIGLPKESSKPIKENSPVKTLVTAVIQKSPSKGGKLDMDNFIPDTETIDNFLDDDASPKIENLSIQGPQCQTVKSNLPIIVNNTAF